MPNNTLLTRLEELRAKAKGKPWHIQASSDAFDYFTALDCVAPALIAALRAAQHVSDITVPGVYWSQVYEAVAALRSALAAVEAER